jgi:peptide/nickel transport system substrate-binding protein
MSLRTIRSLSVSIALLLPIALGACATQPNPTAASNTIRVAVHAPLTDIDPITTTAYITRTHGYLVYDTLFAMNQDFEPQPQMVDTWTVSADQKTWTFKLRDGLKWDDGTPVTAADCVASLERWGARSGVGQELFGDIESLNAPDAQTIVMELKAPDPFVLQALGRLSSTVPFMMPKQIAETGPYQSIEDPIGSGPYMLVTKDWKPDSKAVYVKNPYYVPRKDPSSLAAGAKIAKADKIELIYFANQDDAAKALMDGRIDYFESPSTKLVPMLEADKDIVVTSTDPLGNIGMIRFNALQRPFNNVRIRRAVLMAIDQADYMNAALGDQRWWRTCYSVFPCGTPYATAAGDQIMRTANLVAAKRALKKAGYRGEPVVLLDPVDIPVLHAFAQVTAETLRKLDMNVQVREMGWADLLKERNNRGPVAKGGWSVFDTWWISPDLADPDAIAFSGNPKTGWVGWPKDARLEKYRTEFSLARTLDARKELAAKIQERIYKIGAFGVLGQFFEPVAFRKDLTGITTPIQFYWGLDRREMPSG